jgi:hypothetical protein
VAFHLAYKRQGCLAYANRSLKFLKINTNIACGNAFF